MAEPWRKTGPSFNEWNLDLVRFAKIIERFSGYGWWCRDSRLKYLNVRIDTRNGAFLIFTRDGTADDAPHIQVTPEEMIEVIKSWTKDPIED